MEAGSKAYRKTGRQGKAERKTGDIPTGKGQAQLFRDQVLPFVEGEFKKCKVFGEIFINVS